MYTVFQTLSVKKVVLYLLLRYFDYSIAAYIIINKLRKAQKSSFRYEFILRLGDYVTPFFKQLERLKVAERMELIVNNIIVSKNFISCLKICHSL